jgi:hypothetical protein
MYTHDIIQIVDAYPSGHKQTMNLDPDVEAQSLSMLIKPLGRDARKIAIVAKGDERRLLAYQRAGYEIHPVNGERPTELRQFIRHMITQIKHATPKRIVLVSDDPEFVYLCEAAKPHTEVTVWANSTTVPHELTDSSHGYRPLEELLPDLKLVQTGGSRAKPVVSPRLKNAISEEKAIAPGVTATAELRPLRIFLCHSSNDKSTVRALYQRLGNDGFDPWFDEKKLLPGQDWDREIRIAVRNSDAVIVCLSKGSITKRGYVQKEIRLALDVAGEQPEGAIYIIPVKLEECAAPQTLSHLHWINLFEKDGYERLSRALNYCADSSGIKTRS